MPCVGSSPVGRKRSRKRSEHLVVVPQRTSSPPGSKLTKAHAAALHKLATGSKSSTSMPDKLTRLNAINVATYLANTAVTYGSQVPHRPHLGWMGRRLVDLG